MLNKTINCVADLILSPNFTIKSCLDLPPKSGKSSLIFYQYFYQPLPATLVVGRILFGQVAGERTDVIGVLANLLVHHLGQGLA